LKHGTRCAANQHVSFYPIRSDTLERTGQSRWASSGLMQRSMQHVYSIPFLGVSEQ
jgi:hypothetical protein